MNEIEFLINSFRSNFEETKDIRTAIYGISANTQTVLEACPDYNIPVLLDGCLKEGMMYGKPIIDVSKLPEMEIGRIIIVARAASVKIVLNRIQDFCIENRISVFDVNGVDLIQKYQTIDVDDPYFEVSYEDLLVEIKKHDVISFDIFDTVLMRLVYEPSDAFPIIEKRVREAIGEFPYVQVRAKAEQELLSGPYPTLDAIYTRLRENTGISKEIAECMKQIELDTECELVIPRVGVLDAYHYSLSQGKEVYFVSDMYLGEEQLSLMLEKCGITKYKEIIVSSTFGTMKSQKLFDVLKERVGHKRILHIGDNEYADIECAKRASLDAFYVASARQMLEKTSFRPVCKYLNSLENKLAIGMMIAEVFNNPFVLHNTGGKPVIQDEGVMAYSYVAPYVTTYMYALRKFAQETSNSGILFFARDGYLLKQLYDIEGGHEEAVPSVYFLTSRFPCTICNIHTRDDIIKNIKLGYDGKPGELLKNRFLLRDEEILPYSGDESLEEYVLRHTDAILEGAERLRGYYRAYAEKLGVKSGKRYIVTDLAASGTCQDALTKLLDIQTVGFYFVSIEDNKKNLDIRSLRRISSWFQKTSFICESYVLLENILTSFQPSLKTFENEDTPVFVHESRTQKQLDSVKAMQDAIKKYYKRYVSLEMEQGPDVDLSDMLLGFMRREFSHCGNLDIMHVKMHDEFFKREYSLADIIV